MSENSEIGYGNGSSDNDTSAAITWNRLAT